MNSKVFFLIGLVCCVAAQENDFEHLLKEKVLEVASEKFITQLDCAFLSDIKDKDEADVRLIEKMCSNSDGEKEIRVFNYTTKQMLNYANNQEKPSCLMKLFAKAHFKPSDVNGTISAFATEIVGNQTALCHFLDKYFAPAICMLEKLCPNDEDVQLLETFEVFIQAFGQFMFNRDDEQFSCPVFNVTINPDLYELKEGDHFEEQLLTSRIDCVDIEDPYAVESSTISTTEEPATTDFRRSMMRIRRSFM